MNRDRKYTPKTSCLESHYQRLVARWQTTAAAVTLQEIAEELGCCRRYTRVLLQSMMARQW
ncbi:SgrR family transcriptional regulator, partial [Escherichia coli]|uniref:SgrR family transcriptional regulator n=2 Tax=Enterobacteriaceae TaxID=543 RepID=UPI002245299F